MPDNHALRGHDARKPLQRQGNGEQRNRKNAETFGIASNSTSAPLSAKGTRSSRVRAPS